MYDFSRGIGFGLVPCAACFTYIRYGNITYLLTKYLILQYYGVK